MTVAAVIWDIDGTLIDSEPLHQQSLEFVCLRHGVDISDLAGDHFVGVNIYSVWEALAARFPSTLSRDAWLKEIDTIYQSRACGLSEIFGASTIVAYFQSQGIRQVAVSNSNRTVVDANLNRLGIASSLEFSLSLDDVARPKPDPNPYELALARLQLKATDTIAVEDSPSGVSSAKAAGIYTIAYRNKIIDADNSVQCLMEIANLILGA